MYTVVLPSGVNPIAVNKYTNINYGKRKSHFSYAVLTVGEVMAIQKESVRCM